MKRYDEAYFRRWYHGPDAPLGEAALRRDVLLALAATESVLARPLKTVLDVGCGEGRWQPVLSDMRPGVRYRGVEPSAYAVERFGGERGVVRGRFETLDALDLPDPVDLVVCADVLHYLAEETIRAGIDTLADLVGGVAFLEVFTAEDAELGDREGFHGRPAAWYRGLFTEAGLVPLGMQLWVHRETADGLQELESRG